jgi:predicted dithiol-disulfide oxidoreductase (DUF899 family)
MATYVFETDDPESILAELFKRIGSTEMLIADCVDMSSATIFVATPADLNH